MKTKVDASKFVSILENVTETIKNDPNISLEEARKLVETRVVSSGIKEETKNIILGNLRDSRFTHVAPKSMSDRHALLSYLYNSILMYKGQGVV